MGSHPQTIQDEADPDFLRPGGGNDGSGPSLRLRTSSLCRPCGARCSSYPRCPCGPPCGAPCCPRCPRCPCRPSRCPPRCPPCPRRSSCPPRRPPCCSSSPRCASCPRCPP